MIILKKNMTFFLVSDEKRVRFKSVNLLKSLNSNAMIKLIKDTRDTYTHTHAHVLELIARFFLFEFFFTFPCSDSNQNNKNKIAQYLYLLNKIT